MLTLGSLFDGIGGFPLAGMMCGIKPVWASEIEPFPLKVTAARFPEMKQLGSVTEIDGAEIEPVDIVTFGSPCQDLSVAGSQRGIHDGERSNLFFEAIRIIKEMRARDERAGRTGVDIRPRWAVWENVPGAFSSNRGEDFRAVLEAFAGIREDGLSIPRPKRWSHAGCMVGNGWSVAWRVYDAQYWGVPQRRKRIYLVADLATERAGEILFEREGVRGDPAEGGEAREGTAADAEGSAGGGCLAFKERAGKPGGGKGILPGTERAFAVKIDDGSTPTLRATPSGGNTVPDVVYPETNLLCYEGQSLCANTETAYTIQASRADDHHIPGVCYASDGVKCLNPWDCQSKRQHDVSGAYPTLQAYDGGGGRCDGVCYALQGNGIDRADTAGCNGCGWRANEMYTLNTIDRPAVCYAPNGNHCGNSPIVVEENDE